MAICDSTDVEGDGHSDWPSGWVGDTKTTQHSATNPVILCTRQNPSFG